MIKCGRDTATLATNTPSATLVRVTSPVNTVFAELGVCSLALLAAPIARSLVASNVQRMPFGGGLTAGASV
jgi:hypothetical protein